MLILWILLGLLGLLLLLFLCPVSLRLTYGEDWMIKVSYLFLSLRFPSGKEPRPKKKAKKPSKASVDAGDKPSAKRGKSLEYLVDQALEYLRLGAEILKIASKRIVAKKIRAKVRVARGDAYDTALAYGRILASVHSLLGLLQSICTVKKIQLDIQPDFLSEEDQVELFCKLRVRPLWLLIDLLRLLPGIDLNLLLGRRRPRAKSAPPQRA